MNHKKKRSKKMAKKTKKKGEKIMVKNSRTQYHQGGKQSTTGKQKNEPTPRYKYNVK